MNALDITARGLASRAQKTVDTVADGSANPRMRAAQTAAATEALAAQFGALTGHAGDIHTVETAPYLKRKNLVMRGNGATLYNGNVTPWTTDFYSPTALVLGTSGLGDSALLTLDDIAAIDGNVVTVASVARYAVGDHYYVRGVTETPDHAPRNVQRGVILGKDAVANTLTLDNVLDPYLVADAPKIGTTSEGVSAGFAGQDLHYVENPLVEDWTIISDQSCAILTSGILGGVLRNRRIIGIDGIASNALHGTLAENIEVHATRKIAEISEGSRGAVYRHFRGFCVDGVGNPVSNPAPFAIQIAENSAECVMDDFVVSSWIDYGTTAYAVGLNGGRDNEIRNSQLSFPAHTGMALAVQCGATAGNPCLRNGYRQVQVYAPVCSYFFACNDGGAGIDGCYLIDCHFRGAPTAHAISLLGTNGQIRNNTFEAGDMLLGGGMTNYVITGNYIPDGFNGLTDALMQANIIADNDTDANRRVNAAALITNAGASITTTTANAIWHSATFGAGDFSVGDRISVSAIARAAGAGAHVRYGRLSVTVNGVTTGLGSFSTTTPYAALGIEGEIVITGDTALAYHTQNDTPGVNDFAATVASLAANDLTVNIEYWCQDATDYVVASSARIIPLKRGMRHLAIR